MLARALLKEAIAEGRNIIFDSVLKSERGAREVMTQLNEAGYAVQIVDVEVSLEISQERIMSRWRHGYERGLDSSDPHHFGGRWVPMEYATDVQKGPKGVSKPQDVAQKMANEFPNVTAFRRWRTTQIETAESPARGHWQVNQTRIERGGALTDATRVTAPEAAYRPRVPGHAERGGIER